MKVVGAALSPRTSRHTLVLLSDDGGCAAVERVASLPEVAAAVARLAGEDAFLLGVDIPVVVPPKQARTRPLENLVRRRFGVRLPAGGRAALASGPLGVAGESLIAGLSAAGRPCLPFPDRSLRQSGLAECHAGLVLKALLWTSSRIGANHDRPTTEELFRAYAVPAYRRDDLPARAGWADQAVAVELVIRALGTAAGYELRVVLDELGAATDAEATEDTAGLLDALVIAATARRYLDSPEETLFLGDQETGYTILPADDFIRRLGAGEPPTRLGDLFPPASIRERLGSHARVRPADLLPVPGRPQRLEATFEQLPRYEFDNLDEMLWWKHCRHISGPRLPTEGLVELIVAVGADDSSPLRLVRSRHRTLSFRFEPPASWRARVPTRDGRTYPLGILRAVYETLPDSTG